VIEEGVRMYGVEFVAKIRDGMIKVPDEYRERFTDSVRVILLLEEKTPADGDIIAELLMRPLVVPDFTPLTREDAHARS
jgi:hypothetical protein